MLKNGLGRLTYLLCIYDDMSYKAPPYATLALPPLSCIAFIPSSTIDSFTSIPPKPPEKSPKATKKSNSGRNFVQAFA